MSMNRKLPGHLLILMLLSCTAVISQAQPKVNLTPSLTNSICGDSLIMEEFSASQPAGWTGDFNMGMLITEGWAPSPAGTPTGMTGPDAPYSGSHYLYLETSGPAPLNSYYSIQSPAVDFEGDAAVLRFRYLMYGAEMGSLTVNVLSGPGFATSTEIFKRAGQQHASGAISNWELAFLDLTPYTSGPIKIEFVGMKANGDMGDIGIDDVVACHVVFIPTLGSWAIIILGLLMIIGGTLAVRSLKHGVVEV